MKKYFKLDIFGTKYDNCNKCVVCYENTKTITSCEHQLCVENI